MNTLTNLRSGCLLGVLALAAALAGCGGSDGSSATTSASGAPAAVTGATQQPAAAPLPSSSSGNATLSWVAPTENTDGSVLANLGGYVIHYGTVANDLSSSITVSNPGITTYVVEDLPPGTYYFSMTTSATSGAQSIPSAEASVTIS